MREGSLPKKHLYFVNAWVDGLFLGGLSILIIAVCKLLNIGHTREPVVALAAVMGWLVNWPHFSATSYRLYCSKENIRQYPFTAYLIPVLILTGVAGSFAFPDLIAPYFAKIFSIWSPYHYCGQTLGISLIYARRSGANLGKWEKWGLFGFVYGTFVSQSARAEAVIGTGNFYALRYPTFGLPHWVPGACQFLMYGFGLLFLVCLFLRSMRTKSRPHWILFVPALSQYAWFYVGTSTGAFNEFVPFFHSAQYLLIAWSMQLHLNAPSEPMPEPKKYVLSATALWVIGNLAGGGIPVLHPSPRLRAVDRQHRIRDRSHPGGRTDPSFFRGWGDLEVEKQNRIVAFDEEFLGAFRKTRSPCLDPGRGGNGGLMIQSKLLAFPLFFLSIGFFICTPSSIRAAEMPKEPKLSKERVILHTSAGDIVIAFFPEVAPKTTAQVLRLMKMGVYDSTYFYDVYRGFVAQISNADDRLIPWAPGQKEAIHKIPAELSALKHVRGVLSMARNEGDLNSAETSFSILLGNAPHLDGKYTIFGKVVDGTDVLSQLEQVQVGDDFRPLARVELKKAEVIASGKYSKASLLGPQRILIPPPVEKLASDLRDARKAASENIPGPKAEIMKAAGIWILLILAGLGLTIGLAGARIPSNVQATLGLTVALIACFGVVAFAGPDANRSKWVGTVLFFGLIGLFRAMGRFEQAKPAGTTLSSRK